MHIVILSQNFPPESGSAAAKMADLAGYLAGRGHQVSVVCQVPSYPLGIIYPGYEGAWFRREIKDGYQVTRTWSYASPNRDRFWPRLLNYASFTATALAGIFSGPRPDVCLVYSPPLTLGITATLVDKLWKCPFAFFVMDLWPRAALSLGFLNDGALYRLACGLERFIYRRAARIFVYSRRMAAEVVVDGGDPDKIEHHPLWIDTQLFRPDPEGASKVRQQYGWESKFVVLYGGNLGLAQGLDVMIEAARLLKNNPEVHFVLVGSGVEKDKLVNLTNDYGLSNVEFIGHQPKERISAFFSAANLLFAHLKAAPDLVGTVPEKLLAYMACGRPVVMAAQDGAATDIVKDYGCGLAVPPDNPEALAGAILDLVPQRQEIDEMGWRGRQAVEAHFAAPQVLPAIEASLLKLGASRYHP